MQVLSTDSTNSLTGLQLSANEKLTPAEAQHLTEYKDGKDRIVEMKPGASQLEAFLTILDQTFGEPEHPYKELLKNRLAENATQDPKTSHLAVVARVDDSGKETFAAYEVRQTKEGQVIAQILFEPTDREGKYGADVDPVLGSIMEQKIKDTAQQYWGKPPSVIGMQVTEDAVQSWQKPDGKGWRAIEEGGDITKGDQKVSTVPVWDANTHYKWMVKDGQGAERTSGPLLAALVQQESEFACGVPVNTSPERTAEMIKPYEFFSGNAATFQKAVAKGDVPLAEPLPAQNHSLVLGEPAVKSAADTPLQTELDAMTDMMLAGSSTKITSATPEATKVVNIPTQPAMIPSGRGK